MSFSEHVDVMVGKVFAMLGIYQKTVIRVQKSVHSEVFLHVLGSSASCVWSVTKLNVCRDGLYDMLCVVWVGRIHTICHRMSIDVLFCALTLSKYYLNQQTIN
jgi:hypothetical protein